MWYYCEKLNTLENFDESEIIYDEIVTTDYKRTSFDEYEIIEYYEKTFYHISDINKKNSLIKVIIRE